MRFISLLLLVAFVSAVAVFAAQNQQDVALNFLNGSVIASLAVVVGITYVLGMLSGWSVIGILRRSLRRVAEDVPVRRQHTHAAY
jgi:lipopolysaccharide assembly protein A